jgi:hypothetical protein
MFIAVVYKYHFDTFPVSHRPLGGWEAFIGITKDEAVAQAERAIRIWEATPSIDNNGKPKYSGPYQILVGELVEEAKATKLTLVKVSADGFDRETEEAFL